MPWPVFELGLQIPFSMLIMDTQPTYTTYKIRGGDLNIDNNLML